MASDASSLDSFFRYVDEHQDQWIEALRTAVAIPSISSSAAHRGRTREMCEWAANEIRALGGEVSLAELGMQTMPDGSELPLPPLVLAHFGRDPSKKTICVYGHLDVQPADMSDGWHTAPFELTIKEGKMYGRGSTDDKGPVLAWLHVIRSYAALGRALPVNIRMLLEGMEESGSVGLEEWIARNAAWFEGVHASCISDNYWLGPRKPCLTYGLRGMSYFFLEVTCAGKDLHSGVYGGPVAEGMTDLIKLLSSLHGPDGSIAVPGLMDAVAPLTPSEAATYDSIDFNPAEFAAEFGAPGGLRFPDKASVLKARWRYPSLSIHGVEGAWSGPGAKTVIPHKVTGKFSIRLVPDMDPDQVEAAVRAHIDAVWAGMKSPNAMRLYMRGAGARAWLSDVNDANYTAARKAIEVVYGEAPDLTREGGSIPLTLWLQEATKSSVMLLPIGACDDGAHSTNEKLNVDNYMKGIKVLGAYLEEMGRA